ncbi:MAG: heavy-metal-associated domain-containing protein [Clostridiaceae bacterium]|jgi:Cu+-exporting ATPase|nr:heavy-metal-associated domain-containing protein [Clostridiaceae bacterium]
MEATYTVPSITCSTCSGRIKDGLAGMEGIKGVDVDLKTQSVKVSFDPELRSPGDISRKIAELGYEVMQ